MKRVKLTKEQLKNISNLYESARLLMEDEALPKQINTILLEEVLGDFGEVLDDDNFTIVEK